MRIGTTGARTKRPEDVCQRFRELLTEWGATELHHGDCVGWDKQAHDIAVSLGITTVAHPPDNSKMRAFCCADYVRPALPYLERNREIVLSTVKMIAAPDGPEVARSGTWSTIRTAKKMGRAGVILGLQSTATHSR